MRLQHVAVRCSKLQCVVVRSGVAQRVAVRCRALQCVAVCSTMNQDTDLLQCVDVCCSVLQCVAVCCSVLQCVAVCCSAMNKNTDLVPLVNSSGDEVAFEQVLGFCVLEPVCV